jgi:tetratricopeptide (TPR) repeat protein
VNRAAYGEAFVALEAALRLLERLPTRTDRLRAELALRMTENAAATVLHGYGSPERQYAIERICELSEELGETALLLRGQINLGNLYYPRGEPVRALEIGRRCLVLAEHVQDADVLANTHLLLGLGAQGCGKLDEAASQYKICMRHGGSLSPQDFIVPINSRITSAAHRSTVLQLLGQGSEAVKLAQEGLNRARESQHLFSLGLGLTVVGWLHHYRREPEIVRAHAEAAIALAEEYSFPEWMSWGRFHRGWALVELGQPMEGAPEMEAAIASFRGLGGVPREQFTIATLAHTYGQMGRRDEALVMLDQALGHIERTGEKLDEAEMFRLKGDVLLMGDDAATTDAQRCFRVAIDIAQVQGAKWWELRATTSLARLLRNTGRRDEARTMLAEIYNWFTEGFDTLDLKEAKALLDELSA